MRFVESIRVNESISEENVDILDSIIANLKDEEDAINGYYDMIVQLQNAGYSNSPMIGQLEEIISDEKNHVKVLKQMQFDLDNVQTAKD